MTKKNLSSASYPRVAIIDGLRTPFAKQASAYHGVPALELGKIVVNELIQKNDLDEKEVEQLVFGQVIQMPSAPNIAREIVLGTSLPVTVDAYSVSRACATSFQSVVNVAESIMLGNIKVGIAGGADSTSVLPIGVSKNFAKILVDLSKAKSLKKRLALLATLKLKDLLPVPPAIAEYSTGMSMGATAEQMAKSYQISRKAQDAFAHRSHQLATKAWQQQKLVNEVMTVHCPPYQQFLSQDNCIRRDSSLSDYQRLSPVFDRKHGTVTAATSSPLTDGASAVILMSEAHAKTLGFKPLGYIRSFAFAAIDVWQDMLLGPSYATPIALQRAGLTLADIDLIEMHEAFAAQALVNIDMFASKRFAQQLGLSQAIGEIDLDKFNVLGGSIAYGHPFAATGTRLLTQVLNELQRRGGGIGLTTACAAGGLGATIIVETE